MHTYKQHTYIHTYIQNAYTFCRGKPITLIEWKRLNEHLESVPYVLTQDTDTKDVARALRVMFRCHVGDREDMRNLGRCA